METGLLVLKFHYSKLFMPKCKCKMLLDCIFQFAIIIIIYYLNNALSFCLVSHSPPFPSLSFSDHPEEEAFRNADRV